MKILDYQKKNLLKNGYCVIKNYLDIEEINNLNLAFLKKKEDEENYFASDNKEFWKYLTKYKLVESLRYFLGKKIYYMHDLSLTEARIDDNKRSWHRDNPCRATGVGPDWDANFPYNVVSTITYLSSSKDTNSHLNVLNGSHKSEYKFTISNVLRFIHRKIYQNDSLNFFSNIIQKIIGTKITYNSGDCIIFFANLYHMGNGLTLHNKNRKIIVARYGGEGKHAENFINYVFKHRVENLKKYDGSKIKNLFFDHLIKNDIFHPLPNDKKKIEGVYSNLK